MSMLTVDQVAEKLNISRGTVVNLIKKGDLKAIKIGDLYRIPEENFNALITASEVTTYANGGAAPLSSTKNQKYSGGVVSPNEVKI